jgi:hypothetical protein
MNTNAAKLIKRYIELIGSYQSEKFTPEVRGVFMDGLYKYWKKLYKQADHKTKGRMLAYIKNTLDRTAKPGNTGSADHSNPYAR